MTDPAAALETRPKRVVLLGHGISLYAYFNYVINHAEQPQPLWDEIWAINFLAPTVRHDKLFWMDDLRTKTEHYAGMVPFLKTHDRPIITSVAYPEYPMSVAFPLRKVINAIRDDLFVNTACYAMGYALATGVKELWCYGCDFHYPQFNLAEEGGQNAAYLIGLARSFNCVVRLPRETTLLNMTDIEPIGDRGDYARPLYGYVKQPDLTEPSIVVDRSTDHKKGKADIDWLAGYWN